MNKNQLLGFLIVWVIFRGIVFTGFRFENISIVFIQVINPLIVSMIPIFLAKNGYLINIFGAFKTTLLAFISGEVLSHTVYFVLFDYFMLADATTRYMVFLSIAAQFVLILFIFALASTSNKKPKGVSDN